MSDGYIIIQKQIEFEIGDMARLDPSIAPSEFGFALTFLTRLNNDKNNHFQFVKSKLDYTPREWTVYGYPSKSASGCLSECIWWALYRFLGAEDEVTKQQTATIIRALRDKFPNELGKVTDFYYAK
jgi:hypothetical protein